MIQENFFFFNATINKFRHYCNISSCLIRVDVIVEWEDLEIKVIRPNLECTNGYIHVIDQVGC